MSVAVVPSYKIKRSKFFGREVPIVLQNENGPCPLLGIANVLLLRNILQLPSAAPDVSQDRLLALIAEHLLDSAQVGGPIPVPGGKQSSRRGADLEGVVQGLWGGFPMRGEGMGQRTRKHQRTVEGRGGSADPNTGQETLARGAKFAGEVFPNRKDNFAGALTPSFACLSPGGRADRSLCRCQPAAKRR